MAANPIGEKEIFNHARRLAAPEERVTYVKEACGDDPAAVARILELLRVHDEERGFLESPPDKYGATIGDLVTAAPGSVIGPYKLLEQIGEGAFGIVFVADQHAPVRRRVALKIVKPGMDSRQVLARFKAEQQALALMDHPNIARVLDAGATKTGRPYFVMELVRGIPITDHCDRHNLAVHERLELFVQVCHAVQHAHQKGVIHRDIKPSNVLVTVTDGQPVPKVIDFGLAKAMHQPLTEQTLYTAHGLMVGTPLYMSPEQAEFNNLDVDTRTDIYSLGVILYELLTGTTPLDRKQFQDAAWQEILRLIIEEEPKKPSTKLSGSGSLPAVAARRSLEPAQLMRLVRGDLDWIVMKALDKERSRRYETANGLARDIERYLADDAIEARPPSTGYRLRKFVSRNRGLVIAAALITLALVGGVAGTTWGMIRAVDAQKAEAERAEGERLAKLDAEAANERAQQVEQKRQAEYEANLVGQLVKAEIREVPGIVQEIEKNRRGTDPLLRHEDALAPEHSDKKLRLALALVTVDQRKIEDLREGLLRVSPSEFLVVRDALLPYKEGVLESLWNAALNPNQDAARRFQAACALAAYAPNDQRWSRLDTFVTGRLVTLEASALVAWREALRPAKGQLTERLAAIFRDPTQDSLTRRFATETLADYLSDRPDELFNLLADSQRNQFVVLFNKLVPYQGRATALALGELGTHPSKNATDAEKEALAKRQANSAAALLRLGAPQAVWPLFRHTPDPTTRSHIIDRVADAGVDAEILWNRLTVESDASAKAALILSLGHYPPDLLALKDPAKRRSMMLDVYRNDVDPGVHGAAAWLLRHWNAKDAIKQCDEKLATGKIENRRRWYVTHLGHTMTVITGTVEFVMGSPPSENGNWPGEVQHRVTINRSFALSTAEITGKQMHEFEPRINGTASERPTDDCPITYMSWYDAAQYCRWLSEQEKIPESEMCYPPREQIVPGMKLPTNYLERTGYRLPTEAEWEYACRSGSTTARFFGLSVELLPRYAWYVRNSNERSWPVGTLMPNDLGLFDVYGNVVEWCQDTFDDYNKSSEKSDLDRIVDVGHERVQRGGAYSQIGSGLRSAARSWTAPGISSSRTGFRIARTIR